LLSSLYFSLILKMVFNFGLAVRRSDPKVWKKRMGLRSSVNHRRIKDEDTKRQNGKEKEAIREIVPGMKEDGSKGERRQERPPA
jgi:hypothetical protein